MHHATRLSNPDGLPCAIGQRLIHGTTSGARTMTCLPAVRRLGALLFGFALLIGSRTGYAQPAHPPFAPTRDVTVTYALSGHVGAQHGPDSVRIAIAAGGARARIEPTGFPAYLLADRATGRMLVVIDSLGAFSELRGSMAEAEKFLPSERMRFSRAGSDTLLGRRCTIWDMRGTLAGRRRPGAGNGTRLRTAAGPGVRGAPRKPSAEPAAGVARDAAPFTLTPA
jgi:hypothetical protein